MVSWRAQIWGLTLPAVQGGRSGAQLCSEAWGIQDLVFPHSSWGRGWARVGLGKATELVSQVEETADLGHE